jgi:hypothetical protein
MRTVMSQTARSATQNLCWIGSMFCGVIAILCLFVGQTAYAQQDLGHIFGTVTDQTGAAVPNAKVTITWQATGLSQTVTSNETGYYVSQPLKVGQYTVSAEAAGFTISVIKRPVLLFQ